MQLTTEEKYYARKLFKLEVYSRNGQSFENFFTSVMQFHNSNFTPVKPQGIFGDRKNDGFIKPEGKYYQVYSPEDPTTSEYETIKKLETDFAGLYAHWNKQVTPIKEFHYVINDKYKGDYPTLHPALKKIEDNHSGVSCHPFFTNHLEDVFLGLKKDQIMDLIGPIITPSELESFDSSVMAEVIKHILEIDVPYQQENIPQKPDFDEKIVFNTLSNSIGNLLKFGSYQEGALKEYFRLNSNFAKEDLRNKFNQLYKKGLTEIPDSVEKNDLIFYYILKGAYPTTRNVAQNAILVLMAYYFGYCDIFEEPKLSSK